MRKFVGLDISLAKTAVCVLAADGTLLWQGKVDSEPGPLIEKLMVWQRYFADDLGPYAISEHSSFGPVSGRELRTLHRLISQTCP